MTVASSRRLDAFDQWCLRRIVHIPYTAHITNQKVRRRTGQPPVTSVIPKRRIRLFGHFARADPSQDHSRILPAAINRPPADWRRRAGRPRRTWLRTIELDLRPHNLGLNTAWMRAQDRSKWRQLVETAMLIDGRALDDDDDDDDEWRLVAPIHLKFGTDEGHIGPLGLGPAKFHVNRCTGVGTRPPKWKISTIW